MRIFHLREVHDFLPLSFLRKEVKSGFYFQKCGKPYVVLLRISDWVLAREL